MIYDFKVKKTNGEEILLEKYKGKVLLIVNTASGCGFTPQYEGLQKIYDEYKQVVFKVAYKYSRNSEVANDIAHDVFVLFMQDAKQRKSINEYTNIKAWLTVTTRNTAYNYLVKMKHEIYISEESEKTLEMYIDEKVQEASAESRCLNELRHKKHKSVHDNYWQAC